MSEEMTQAVAVREGHDLAPAKLFAGSTGAEVIAQATEIANALNQVIKDKKLYTTISGRNHVRVEGWTLLGSLTGVFPVLSWTKKLEDGWEARVEAQTLSGQVVGAAEAQCTRAERMWSKRDDYALRSMAQTRATSKAMRQPLGFIVTLAGYDATPSEEVPSNDGANDAPPPRRQQPKPEPDVVDGEYTEVGEPERFGSDKQTLEEIVTALKANPVTKDHRAYADLLPPKGRTVKERLAAYARLHPDESVVDSLVADVQPNAPSASANGVSDTTYSDPVHEIMAKLKERAEFAALDYPESFLPFLPAADELYDSFSQYVRENPETPVVETLVGLALEGLREAEA